MLTRTGGNPRRLDRFVKQINAYLFSLSFYDVGFILLASLKQLVEFNDKINFAYFWPNNYHLNIIGYYVSQVTGLITLQNIHTHNYNKIGAAIASSVKRGMDAKIGIRIESQGVGVGGTLDSISMGGGYNRVDSEVGYKNANKRSNQMGSTNFQNNSNT